MRPRMYKLYAGVWGAPLSPKTWVAQNHVPSSRTPMGRLSTARRNISLRRCAHTTCRGTVGRPDLCTDDMRFRTGRDRENLQPGEASSISDRARKSICARYRNNTNTENETTANNKKNKKNTKNLSRKSHKMTIRSHKISQDCEMHREIN